MMEDVTMLALAILTAVTTVPLGTWLTKKIDKEETK